MHSVHFSAYFMHYPRCTTLPVRTWNCRLLQRHLRDVTPTPARITDITLSRMTLAERESVVCYNEHFHDVTLTAARITDITLSRMTYAWSHFVPRIRHSLPTKKVKKVKHFPTIHTLRSLPDQRGRCVQSLVQIGWEMWIFIRYKQIFSFIYKMLHAAILITRRGRQKS